MQKRLADCQRVIGYWFANPQLLEIALTHSSVRTPDRECNERQEFLGDSVLGLAMTEELYKRLPDQQEGELTRIKSAVVSRGALYRVSMRLGLPRFIEIAKGVGRRDEMPVSLTANLVESIIGAIYLDAGFFPAREFILRHLGPELEDTLNDRVPRNYKSLLQHEAQHLLGATPIYRTVEEEGPDHRKSFTVACILKGTEYGRATGINKKEAEQEAARHALEALTRRGHGGRRRRGREGDRDAARDGGRDSLRAAAHPSSDEDAWREWAEREAQAAGAGGAQPPSPATRPAVGPESEEAYLEPHDRGPAFGAGVEAEATAPAELQATDALAGAPPPGGSGERDAGAPPLAAEGPGAASGPEGGEDERRGRRRRRGGRGRGRGRRDAAEGEGGREGAAEAPVSDGAAVAPESPSPDEGRGAGPRAPHEGEVARGGDRARRGARGRFERYSDAPAGTPSERRSPPAAPRDSADAPPPERAPVAPAEPEHGRGRRTAPKEPLPAAPSRGGRGFGAGVASDGGPPPALRPVEKAVTPVGGVPAVKKAPKSEPPPQKGGFGTGLA